MRVRTFTGEIPLDIELAINNWLAVCPFVRVTKIHYQDAVSSGLPIVRRASALVEFEEIED